MDEIRIEDLKVYAYHGVYREENEKGQNFYINAILYTDTKVSAKEDRPECMTSYGEVCRFIHRYVGEHVFQLIETVAEKTAEAVLLEFPRLAGITLEVRKPEAPIRLEFGSVSVKITRKWHTACLCVGSNMGEKQTYIRDAIRAIDADERCSVLKQSELMLTTPYGEVEQDDFLNGALLVKTLYTPEELLTKLHELEAAAGRERIQRWGPRTLDLDIIFYDDLVLDTDMLRIPHVDMHNRDFVLAPLAQIAPYQMHPVLGKAVIQLYEELQKTGERHVIGQDR